MGSAKTYNSKRKEALAMKEKVHTRSTFRTKDMELLKKAVTAKIEKLVNEQLKKAG